MSLQAPVIRCTPTLPPIAPAWHAAPKERGRVDRSHAYTRTHRASTHTGAARMGPARHGHVAERWFSSRHVPTLGRSRRTSGHAARNSPTARRPLADHLLRAFRRSACGRELLRAELLALRTVGRLPLPEVPRLGGAEPAHHGIDPDPAAAWHPLSRRARRPAPHAPTGGSPLLAPRSNRRPRVARRGDVVLGLAARWTAAGLSRCGSAPRSFGRSWTIPIGNTWAWIDQSCTARCADSAARGFGTHTRNSVPGWPSTGLVTAILPCNDATMRRTI